MSSIPSTPTEPKKTQQQMQLPPDALDPALKKRQKKAILRKTAFANSRGQSLIEYLLLTSLMAVAAMGVMQVMSHSVNAKFAQITESIQGGNPGAVHFEAVTKADYEKKDMSDFMNGATKKKKKEKKSNGTGLFGPAEIEF